MRRAILLSALAGSLAVTLCLAGSPRRSIQAHSEVEELREEIAGLRQRIEDVERRLKDHAIVPMPRNDNGRQPMIDELLRELPPRQVPPGWVPYEFNGMRFYVIPVKATQARPAEPKK